MDVDKLYRIAARRHGDLARDVVHDLICRLPEASEAYLVTCLKHTRPERVRTLEQEQPSEEVVDEVIMHLAVKSVQAAYPVEVDTFLECTVNGSFKAFSARSGISRSVLDKICKFAQNEIRTAYRILAKE